MPLPRLFRTHSISFHLFPYHVRRFSIDRKDYEARRITKLGGVANLLLGIFKGAAGYVSGSNGLIADAANSFSDILTDIVVYFALVKARSGTSPDKPWGYGKIESLGTLLVGGILVSTGAGIGYSALSSAIDLASLHPVLDPSPSSNISFPIVSEENLPLLTALVVAGGSALSKEYIFRKTLSIGQEINSSIIIANAWHHRSDAFVSSAVFIGLLGSTYGYPLMDSLTGVLVSGIICKQGITLLLESIKDLTDSSASEEVLAMLSSHCLTIPGILTVISLNGRLSGPYIFVDCTVGVSGELTASTAHHLAETVKHSLLHLPSEISSQIGKQIADVIVHVDPIGTSGNGDILPEYSRNYQDLVALAKRCVLEVDGIEDVSHVQVYYRDDGSIGMKIDVMMREELTIKQAYVLAREARIKVEQSLPGGKHEIDIDMELNDR